MTDELKRRLLGLLPREAALEGRFSAHHALLVSHLLSHVEYLDETIAALSAEIEERVRPFRAQA